MIHRGARESRPQESGSRASFATALASSPDMTPEQILAQPLRLRCGASIPNRIAKSAMSEALGTTDNRPTARLEHLYGAWADGGVG
ncbi:hypothetical protein ABTI08_20100, partial [Acinetobacter baumannii]